MLFIQLKALIQRIFGVSQPSDAASFSLNTNPIPLALIAIGLAWAWQYEEIELQVFLLCWAMIIGPMAKPNIAIIQGIPGAIALVLVLWKCI